VFFSDFKNFCAHRMNSNLRTILLSSNKSKHRNNRILHNTEHELQPQNRTAELGAPFLMSPTSCLLKVVTAICRNGIQITHSFNTSSYENDNKRHKSPTSRSADMLHVLIKYVILINWICGKMYCTRHVFRRVSINISSRCISNGMVGFRHRLLVLQFC